MIKRPYLATALILVVMVVVIYFAWQLKRYVHYSWGYESYMQITICQMVKREALKNLDACD